MPEALSSCRLSQKGYSAPFGVEVLGRVLLTDEMLLVPRASTPSVVAVALLYVLPYSATGKGRETAADPDVPLDGVSLVSPVGKSDLVALHAVPNVSLRPASSTFFVLSLVS